MGVSVDDEIILVLNLLSSTGFGATLFVTDRMTLFILAVYHIDKVPQGTVMLNGFSTLVVYSGNWETVEGLLWCAIHSPGSTVWGR